MGSSAVCWAVATKPVPKRRLPEIRDAAAFDELLAADLWQPALTEICRRHGLDPALLAPVAGGSSVIRSAGEVVIKLMPPFWAKDCAAEIAVLQVLSRDPELPVPRLLASGELEGWPYFVMSRLPGIFCTELWDTLPEPAKFALMAELGRLLRQLHALPVDGLDAIRVDWPAFVQAQCEGFLARQQAYGVAPELARELQACLAAEAPALAAERDAVLMHCELMPAHLLLEPTDEAWRISGLIDFGDPLVGHHGYEFGGVFVFFTAGRPDLRCAFLQAYGYHKADFGPDLARRLMAAALLHRFGTVPLGLQLMRKRNIQTSFYETFFSLKPAISAS